MNLRLHSALALALALSVGGCQRELDPVQTPAPEPTPTPVTKTELPQLPTAHPAVPALAVASRGPRRMSVEQLERSLEVIAQLPEGAITLDESLALTLGRPDYLRVTEESLEPSPLFMKFMTDLAGILCQNLSDGEAMRAPEERALLRYEDRDENLRYLLLRFLGIDGAPAVPYVTRLGAVYDAAKTGARGERGGWEAVCIALITSPEFLLY